MSSRITLYFSPRKDKDLLEVMKSVQSGDINYFLKNLLRDDIRYQQLGQDIDKTAVIHNNNSANVFSTHTPIQPTAVDKSSLLSMTLEKREVTDKELSDNFDSL